MKTRKKPLILKKLQALIPRLRPEFTGLQDIKWDERNRRKGYEGEKRTDYYVGMLAEKFIVLYDICLEVNRITFQIDTVMMSGKAVYIIETKDYSKKIIFNTKLNQCIRSDGKIETGYQHPITQAENHKLLLETWLVQHGFRNIPVHYFVALSDPTVIIEVVGNEDEIAEVVFHADLLPKKVLDKDSLLDTNIRQMNHAIGQSILREEKEFNIDVLTTYQVKSEDILSGVHCPECRTLGMKRIYGKWICLRCKTTSKKAHLEALSDYLLLIKPHINNNECMRFLNITSKDVASRLLRSSGLNYDLKHRRWYRK